MSFACFERMNSRDFWGCKCVRIPYKPGIGDFYGIENKGVKQTVTVSD